uniref:Uncharacterized protein n=1 Tax=Candidatus Kentrum sp. FW TaxID=2126338 RepID=A0A450TXC8_9GAMM|nr:MAG: hypothetical protein BECKFW1821C_GA0114237_105618 [Candidatus Kentron sp. FW]
MAKQSNPTPQPKSPLVILCRKQVEARTPQETHWIITWRHSRTRSISMGWNPSPISFPVNSTASPAPLPIQFIAPDGEKRLLKNGRKQGCFIHVHGDTVNPSGVIICEGWATGCTLAENEPGSLVLPLSMRATSSR